MFDLYFNNSNHCYGYNKDTTKIHCQENVQIIYVYTKRMTISDLFKHIICIMQHNGIHVSLEIVQ